MPICHKRKLIFIHVPKTGGTSVEKVLRLESLHNLFSYKKCIASMPNIADIFNGIDKNIVLSITPQHLTSCHLKNIFPSQFETYTKFAIVRNPYDRIVSEYHYINDFMKHDFLKQYRDISFLEFLKRVRETPRMLQVSLFDNHFLSQSEYLRCLNKEQDNIFRYENIEDVFRWLNVKCEHKRKSKNKKDYRSYYCKQSKRIVKYMYEEDLETFKYSF